MAERKTIRKWFWVWDFEEQERWLNEMAEEGWALTGVGFCRYEFEKTEPNEYTIRLELKQPDDNYISFVEETGAEYIGKAPASWLFFRRKSELGQFDLISGIDSKIQHLQGIYRLLLIIGAMNIFIGISNQINPSTLASKMGLLNLFCAMGLMYGAGRIKGRIDYLEKERLVRE